MNAETTPEKAQRLTIGRDEALTVYRNMSEDQRRKLHREFAPHYTFDMFSASTVSIWRALNSRPAPTLD